MSRSRPEGRGILNNITLIAALIAVAVIAAAVTIYFLTRSKASESEAKSEAEVKGLLEEAKKQAEIIRKEAELKVKEKILASKAQFEQEFEGRRQEISKMENRLQQREEGLSPDRHRRTSLHEGSRHTPPGQVPGPCHRRPWHRRD